MDFDIEDYVGAWDRPDNLNGGAIILPLDQQRRLPELIAFVRASQPAGTIFFMTPTMLKYRIHLGTWRRPYPAEMKVSVGL